MRLTFLLASSALSLTIIGARAAILVVTTVNDSGSGSLRQAILDANTASGDDTITFSVSGTITLASALPPITGNTTIEGTGTNLLTISGNNSVNVFIVGSGAKTTISSLTIADGMATNYLNGAGIANAGNLTISNCALVNNRNFGGWGGAVFNSGKLEVIGSAFFGNLVTGEDGAITGGGGGAGMGGALFTTSGNTTISNCNFVNNRAIGGNGAEAASNRIGRGGGVNGGTGEFNKHGGFGGGGCGFPPHSEAGDGGFGGGGGGGGLRGAGGVGGGDGNGCGSVHGGGGGGGGIGGSIFVHSGRVTIVECSFVGNEAVGGAGGTDGCSPARSGSPGGGIGADFYNFEGTILPTVTTHTFGGGTFQLDPSGPPYLNVSTAKVTAVPTPGWTLLQWLGDAAGTNPVVGLHMNRSRLVQAMFGTSLRTVASSITVVPQAELYPYGTPIRLTAVPPQGSYFVSWKWSVSGTNNPTTIVVSLALDIGCDFAPLGVGESSLSVVENGRGQVVVVPAKNRYAINETVGLIAVPESGQQFLGWTGDADGDASPMIVSMLQSRIITANFTKRPTLRVSTPLEGLVEGGFQLTLLGEFGSPYSILGSTNLLEWIPVGIVTNTYGTIQLTDPAGTQLPWRSYRAVGE